MGSQTPGSEELAYLIGRVALGDRAAFKRLYDLTNRYLLHVAKQRVRDQARAEDVVQDTYMEVWRKAAGYSPEVASPMTWLMMIANARAIDAFRKVVREQEVIPKSTDEEGAVPPESSEGMFDAFRDLFGSDVMTRLEKCFNCLSQDEQRAITDIRVRGMTFEEAAQAYERPRQTVAAWVRRGIEKLSGCMQS